LAFRPGAVPTEPAPANTPGLHRTMFAVDGVRPESSSDWRGSPIDRTFLLFLRISVVPVPDIIGVRHDLE
jgi:hypothetical protein